MPTLSETPEQARLKAFYAKVDPFSEANRRVWEGQPDVRVERVSDAEFDLYTAQAGNGYYS